MKKEFNGVKLLMVVLCLCGVIFAADAGVMVKFEKGATSAAIPIKLFDNIIYMQVRINDSESLDFIYDTGASMISCIDGESVGVIGRVKTIRMGNIVLHDPVVDFSRDKKGALASDMFNGIIGADILYRFTVVFDYEKKIIALKKNSNFDRPFEYDMSGIYPVAHGPGLNIFKIHRIVKDSPAETAGLKPGDIIAAIDGQDTTAMTLEQVKQVLKSEPGRKLNLRISREGKILQISLTLKRLI
jgi:membrane-associated protease RseP (regulator of RpoE activity)